MSSLPFTQQARDYSALPASSTRANSGRHLVHAMTLIASLDDSNGLVDVSKRIRDARNAIFINGAGVSTGAQIPDFRSSKGLFSAGKGSDVKELFHIKCLSSLDLLPLHHALLNNLAGMSNTATPTAYHRLLKSLDERGKLLRCYTQNIDGLEAKAGLETGIASVSASSAPATPKAGPSTPRKNKIVPRCVPLHGILDSLHCTLCSTVCPLADHLPLPSQPLPCPTCSLDTSLRKALNERPRQTGQLRASVILYGEDHPSGHLIGSILERDIRKADLLVVAGTSLVIPGVRRMVKEVSKALRARYVTGPRSIYINWDSPPPDLEGVFDVWVKGDVQEFVLDVVGDLDQLPLTPRKTPKSKSTLTPKSPRTPKKVTPKKAPQVIPALSYLPTPRPTPPTRKRQASVLDTPSKKPRRARSYSTTSESSLSSLEES